MKVSLKNEYRVISCFSLLSIASIFLNGFTRTIVALPFVLLLPGYLLTVLLFPRVDDLKKLDRVVFSVGLSILIVPWIGFLLNYLLGGIRLLPMMSAVTFLNLIFTGLGWHRRKRLPEDERFILLQKVNWLKWKDKFNKKKSLYSVQIIAVLLLLFTIFYTSSTTKISDSFTEFYITGKHGKAAAYPEQLEVGEYGAVKAHIINHEQQKIMYTIEIRVDGDLISTITPISLENLGKWEGTVFFKAAKPDNAVKVDILLFKNTLNSTPYRRLNLWVKVVPRGEGKK